MQRIKTLLAVGLLLMAEGAAAQSGRAAVRFRCEGDSVGAAVSINGQFKGECPFNLSVPEGTLKIRAHQKIDQEYERVFEQEVRVAADSQKNIDVDMGPKRLTAEGRRLQEERAEAQRRARAEREQAELQRAKEQYDKRRFSTEMLHLRHDARIDARLKERSLEQGPAFPYPECQECPVPVPQTKAFAATFWRAVQRPSAEETQALNRLLARMRAYVTSNRQTFVPPSSSLALPCENVDDALRRAAGLMSQDDMTLDEWRQGGERWKTYWRDVRLWVVSGQCSAAGLHGPVEFWFKGIEVAPKDDGVNYGYVSHLGHVRVAFSDGQPTGVAQVSRRKIDLYMRRSAQEDNEEFVMEERDPVAPHLARSTQVSALLPSSRLGDRDQPRVGYWFSNEQK